MFGLLSDDSCISNRELKASAVLPGASSAVLTGISNRELKADQVHAGGGVLEAGHASQIEN